MTSVSEGGGTRRFAASAVGWLIVVIVAWIVLRSLAGLVGWALQGILVIVALVFLVNVYFRLKARDD